MLTTIRVYIALARRFGIRNLLTAAVEARRRGMAKSNHTHQHAFVSRFDRFTVAQ